MKNSKFKIILISTFVLLFFAYESRASYTGGLKPSYLGAPETKK